MHYCEDNFLSSVSFFRLDLSVLSYLSRKELDLQNKLITLLTKADIHFLMTDVTCNKYVDDIQNK